jgi:hypothetical protein
MANAVKQLADEWPAVDHEIKLDSLTILHASAAKRKADLRALACQRRASVLRPIFGLPPHADL